MEINLLVQGIPSGGGRDSARLVKFCGLTRIMPWRGASMSAMSNAMETISGRIGSNLDPAFASRTIADQQVTADADSCHQDPCPGRDTVPIRCLRVSLRIQNVVHTRNGQGDNNMGRLRCGWRRTAVHNSLCNWAVRALIC